MNRHDTSLSHKTASAGEDGQIGKRRSRRAGAHAAQDERTTARHFIFCTGVEGSYPTIKNKQGRTIRRDGMRMSNHYRRWREDFELVKELGITFLRYGPPYHECHRGPMRY